MMSFTEVLGKLMEIAAAIALAAILFIWAKYEIVLPFIRWRKERSHQQACRRQAAVDRFAREAKEEAELKRREVTATAELTAMKLGVLRPYPIYVYARLKDGRETTYADDVKNILRGYGLTVLVCPDGARKDCSYLKDDQLVLVVTTWTEEGTDNGDGTGGIPFVYRARAVDCQVVFKQAGVPPQEIGADYWKACVYLSTGSGMADDAVAKMVLDECLVGQASDWLKENCPTEMPVS